MFVAILRTELRRENSCSSSFIIGIEVPCVWTDLRKIPLSLWVLSRVSAKDAPEDAPAVLFNAHFDSPLGSPGASDCASCVASLLETLRHIIDTKWVPPAPVIFLFNGAEELFLLVRPLIRFSLYQRMHLLRVISHNTGGQGSVQSAIFLPYVVYTFYTRLLAARFKNFLRRHALEIV
jgi:hypothetical protein